MGARLIAYCLFTKQLIDFFYDFARRKMRFHDVLNRTQFHAPFNILALSKIRQKHNLNFRKDAGFAQAAQYIKTVIDRHYYIQKQYIGSPAGCFFNRLFAVCAGLDVKARLLEFQKIHLGDVGIVVNYENLGLFVAVVHNPDSVAAAALLMLAAVSSQFVTSPPSALTRQLYHRALSKCHLGAW